MKRNKTKRNEIKKKETHLKVVVADATTTTLGDDFNKGLILNKRFYPSLSESGFSGLKDFQDCAVCL